MVTESRGGTVLGNKVQDIVTKVGGQMAVLGKGFYTFLVSIRAEWTTEQSKLMTADR